MVNYVVIDSYYKAPVEDLCAEHVCIILTYTCMEDYFHHALKQEKRFWHFLLFWIYILQLQERKYK